MEFKSRGSSGVAKAGLTTGIIGTSLATLGILGGGAGALAGLTGNRSGETVVVPMNMGGCWNNGYGYNNGCGCGCSEDHFVNRYELSLQQQIAEKDSQIALRDANTYMDQKTLELYKYFDGEIKDVRAELSRQAVINQKTEDSFVLAKQDLDCCCKRLQDAICDERQARRCADNQIINYTNATFYPKQVANVTTGTTTTAQVLYNPLPQDNDCCCSCGNN